MEVITIDFPHAFPDTLTELGAGLIHGQQDARDLQLWVEAILYRAYHIQHSRNPLAGQEVSLHGDDAII